MTFKMYCKRWLKKGHTQNPQMDFAKDLLRDKDSNGRVFKSWPDLRRYLEFRNAVEECIIGAKIMFYAYQKSEQGKNKKEKKVKIKVDGLGPTEIKKLRNACRLVWHRSHVRKICVQRSIGKDGFHRCELCKKKTPQIKIDHKIKVGDLDGGFIKRLFCPSSGLQALCKHCHDAKTKEERRQAKEELLNFL
jgi:hypothetical protein